MINTHQPDYFDTPDRRTTRWAYRPAPASDNQVDVSIITPFYNTPAIFVETVASVRRQTFQNWEWIIVNDGSPKAEALAMLEEIASKDSRIKVVHQANTGTAGARNNGFRHSSGTYICLLDHDDLLEPTYLEKCCWFLESYPQFAFCNSYNVFFGEDCFLWTRGFEQENRYLESNSAPPFAVIRRSAWAAIGGFDDSIRVLYEDWDFWLKMASKGHWGYTLPEYLQWYRKQTSGRYEKILESGYQHTTFASEMKAKYPELQDQFPAPKRSHPKPYSTFPQTWQLRNRLEKTDAHKSVLFLIPWMVIGGADRVNLDIIEGLTAQGHSVTVCATLIGDHTWEHLYTRLTPDVFVLPNFLNPVDYPRFLAYLIASREVDTVLIAGSTIGYRLLPYLRAVSPTTAFVDMCHVEEPHWWNGGHPRFGVGYQDVLDLNIATTRHLAKWMAARGADAERLRVMHTGVRPVPIVAESERPAGHLLIADAPVIIFAGRLSAQKRPLLLIDVLKTARDSGLRFNALILGDGEEKHAVSQKIAEAALDDQVQMLGAVSHQKWLTILPTSDIFLMPSQYEGISVALLEAMSAGVVPIVANVGGHAEVVTRETGFLIEQEGDEVLHYVQALQRLLTDAEARQRMSRECQTSIRTTFSSELMIGSFLGIVDEAKRYRAIDLRCKITAPLGLELATQILDRQPLGPQDVALERLRQQGVAVLPESLMGAAHLGNLELIDLLLQAGGSPNLPDRHGNYPLIEASWCGHLHIVQSLLRNSADVAKRNSSGASALIAAVQQKHTAVVEILLNHGADPNAVADKETSCLISACWSGDYQIVKMLLQSGAHPNYRRPGDGMTALRMAKDVGNKRIVHLLCIFWAAE